ncbi:short-chain fatty acyl-CoA regulator family protein [Corynebacterium mendelii]|uniref:DUF2083 domain-containing protein n=1 Tax=Corynebacterium mendelii TaxID=2765362 RepID=A0A939DYY1_9CORY|nr:short-chain fatty acyl-CoA regulator family protein [Corynebacterium mendelii]MBN9643810.1 DUF2083 domain-containing protein [Corynebacterium mendelii]
MDKIYAGSRLKQLRQERGLNQAELAQALGLSASYVNQIEHDVRPVTVPVLLKVTEVFGIDPTFVSRDSNSRLIGEVREVLTDPEIRLDPGRVEEMIRVAADHPALAHVLVDLHTRLRNVREAEVFSGHSNAAPQALPHEEVRDFFYAHRNYFDSIDTACEQIACEMGHSGMPGGLADRLTDRLFHHGITTTVAPQPTGFLHRFDRATNQIILTAGLSEGQRAFRLAAELALVELSGLVNDQLDSHHFSAPGARPLALKGLASYAAAATIMPYRDFLARADGCGYDIEQLEAMTGLNYETVAHRLSTLQRPGREGVPFTFVRVDRAGNMSKRQSATGLHLGRAGGTCPLWNVYKTFTNPGEIMRQFTRMPDGGSYLWISRTVRHHRSSFAEPGKIFAVGLGCEARHAHRTVYATGLDFTDPAAATPIGPGCRTCSRTDCSQRAFPAVGQTITVDPHTSRVAPY